MYLQRVVRGIAFSGLLFVAVACGSSPGNTPATEQTPAAGNTSQATPAAMATTAPTQAAQPTAAPTIAPSPTPQSTTAAQPTAAAATQPAPTAAQGGGDSDAQQAILQAQQATLKMKSYRVRQEISAAGKVLTNTIEFVAPDRFHMQGLGPEMIVVSSTTYMKQGDQWMKVPGDMSGVLAQARDPGNLPALLGSIKNARFVGNETLEGAPMRVYTYDSGIEGITSTAKLWIGVQDGLPHRSEIDGEFSNVKSHIVMSYYDYNADIKIEPPVVQ